MSERKVGPYQKRIRLVMRCSASDAAMIEDIMRNDVLHTVALDWLSNAKFDAAAREAVILLDENRAEYEKFYAGARAMFEQGQRERV
jgi:hypothetical protein